MVGFSKARRTAQSNFSESTPGFRIGCFADLNFVPNLSRGWPTRQVASSGLFSKLRTSTSNRELTLTNRTRDNFIRELKKKRLLQTEEKNFSKFPLNEITVMISYLNRGNFIH